MHSLQKMWPLSQVIGSITFDKHNVQYSNGFYESTPILYF